MRRAASCPPGGCSAWKERYAPKVAEIVRHREVVSPVLTVVVVAWRSPHSVGDCLRALRQQQGFGRDAVEIVLVDNGGLGPARAELAELVDVELRMTENVGLCPARNLGAAWATAPYINFIDDDGIVEPGYFAAGLSYFDDATVVAVRTKILFKKHRYFTTLARHYDRGPEPREDYLVTEGSCFVRRDDYLLVGGFGEYLSGFEGAELTFRWKLANPEARVLYAPDAVMRHDYIDSWKKFLRKEARYATACGNVADLHPELRAFMQQHKDFSFPWPRVRADERLARALLNGTRKLLRHGTRLWVALRGKDGVGPEASGESASVELETAPAETVR